MELSFELGDDSDGEAISLRQGRRRRRRKVFNNAGKLGNDDDDVPSEAGSSGSDRVSSCSCIAVVITKIIRRGRKKEKSEVKKSFHSSFSLSHSLYYYYNYYYNCFSYPLCLKLIKIKLWRIFISPGEMGSSVETVLDFVCRWTGRLSWSWLILAVLCLGKRKQKMR